jgi:hypothetical protein
VSLYYAAACYPLLAACYSLPAPGPTLGHHDQKRPLFLLRQSNPSLGFSKRRAAFTGRQRSCRFDPHQIFHAPRE